MERAKNADIADIDKKKYLVPGDLTGECSKIYIRNVKFEGDFFLDNKYIHLGKKWEIKMFAYAALCEDVLLFVVHLLLSSDKDTG